MAAAASLFCFGLGYTALALARALQRGGWVVGGTTRDTDKAARLMCDGIHAHVLRNGDPLPQDALSKVTHVLSSVSPDADGDPILRHYEVDIAAAADLGWVGYLSTTGVYGDRQGGWVDEATPCSPALSRGQRRVVAEQGWLDFGRQNRRPTHIFRLAGIYGPGRNALVSARAGRARRIVKPGQVFSRIHVDDIVQVLRASMAQPRAGAVYNVCDDEAAPPQDVIAYACALLGVEPPPELPYDQAELSDMARSFYTDNKRVRNDLVKQEFGVKWLYPSYREGLRALVRDVPRT